MILSIDPGPDKSAFIVWDGKIWIDGKPDAPNADVRALVLAGGYDQVGIEMIECMGMPVGREVFETCIWIGRFKECHLASFDPKRPSEWLFAYRRAIKHHFCNSAKATDSNIRQAILDRFGGKEVAIGKKVTPGPLYGVTSHMWSALAIALFIQDHSK